MGQYVGARYVPDVTGDTYDPTQAYENLVVVDNGMGTSYISRKPVPAGTPLTDTEYWAIYGASNGAIINLQNQIDDMNDGSIPGSLQNQIDSMQPFAGKSFLIIGDSISDENFLINNWVKAFRDKHPTATITNNSLNGRALSTVPSILTGYDPDDYDYVIIFAGINDYKAGITIGNYSSGTTLTYTLLQIGEALQGKSCIPYLITPLNCTASATGAYPLNLFRDVEVGAAKYYGLRWINGAGFPHLGGKNTTVYMPDGTHPNAAYSEIMADYITEKLLAGGDTSSMDSENFSVDMDQTIFNSAVTTIDKAKIAYLNGELHFIMIGNVSISSSWYTTILDSSPINGFSNMANFDVGLVRSETYLTINNIAHPAFCYEYNGGLVIQHESGLSGTAKFFIDYHINPRGVYVS